MTNRFTMITVHTAGGAVDVTGERTDTPGLAIAPGIGSIAADEHASTRLSGGVALTHVPTGRVVYSDSGLRPLHGLAAQLGEIDWTFTDPDHFKTPAGQAAAKRVWELIRAWEHVPEDETGDAVPTATAAHDVTAAPSPARKLLADQLDWLARTSTENKVKWAEEVPEDRRVDQLFACRVAEYCEAFGLVYLLAVLRSVSPADADTAARFLAAQWDAGDSLSEWAWEWQQQFTQDRPLTLSGIPHPPTEFLAAPQPVQPDTAEVGR